MRVRTLYESNDIRTHFVSLDKHELDRIVEEKDAKSTKQMINSSVNTLREYCSAKNRSLLDIETFEAAELNYSELRKSDRDDQTASCTQNVQ